MGKGPHGGRGASGSPVILGGGSQCLPWSVPSAPAVAVSLLMRSRAVERVTSHTPCRSGGGHGEGFGTLDLHAARSELADLPLSLLVSVSFQENTSSSSEVL